MLCLYNSMKMIDFFYIDFAFIFGRSSVTIRSSLFARLPPFGCHLSATLTLLLITIAKESLPSHSNYQDSVHVLLFTISVFFFSIAEKKQKSSPFKTRAILVLRLLMSDFFFHAYGFTQGQT